jgi:hypothetical protein
MKFFRRRKTHIPSVINLPTKSSTDAPSVNLLSVIFFPSVIPLVIFNLNF